MTERTIEALVDAAEAEFCVHGFAGASLRGIMRSAGANPAAVHYHFGSREELVRAVLDRTLAPLNARRLELLTVLRQRSDGGPLALDDLVAALVRPDLEAMRELRHRNPRAVRLVGIIYAHPTAFVKEQVEAHFGPVAEAFMPELMRSLPAVPAAEIAWRVRWCVFGALSALLNAEGEEPLDVGDLETATRRLVAFVAAGLAAPAEHIEPIDPGGEP